MHSEDQKYNVVILGAGEPFSGDVHSALRRIDSHGSVLDWQINALRPFANSIQFVGGYQIEKIFQRHRDIVFVNNQDWQQTGSVESLFLANITPGIPILALYSDIIFRPETLKKVLQAHKGRQLVAATDSSYPARYTQNNMRPPQSTELIEESELVGIFVFPVEIVDKLIDIKKNNQNNQFSKKHISALIDFFCSKDEKFQNVDIPYEWSDLNISASVAKFIMGSKAETLERLESAVTSASICPQYRFKSSDYIKSSDSIVSKTLQMFPASLLAVRSSALCEDGFETANAGVFHSALNVAAQAGSINEAINQVLSSYPDDGMDHQVFIQPMVKNVCASGVIMTRSLDTGAPYITINYSEGSETDKITGGTSENGKILTLCRENANIPQNAPAWIKKAFSAVKEVEFLLDYDALDIEFAADTHGSIYILQVRPITLTKISQVDDSAVSKCLQDATTDFIQRQSKLEGVTGSKAIFGIMPDWNPAEIIGVRPNVLAATLYDHIITHDVWAKQRHEYGYRNLKTSPLMYLFCGQPYIDVRASLNSFIPASIADSESEKLVDFYTQWLIDHPYLHDKIEFDVIPTCYSLDFGRKWKSRLEKGGFSDTLITNLEKSLKAITSSAFQRIESDFAGMEDISLHHDKIIKSGSPPLTKALALLKICKEFGTLNFAHLARAAFIAVTLLKSLVSEGILSDERLQDYLLSMNTVSSRFAKDGMKVSSGKMSFADFSKIYGHLRPGTYDASCPNYASAPDIYLKGAIEKSPTEHSSSFAWTANEALAIKSAFVSHGLAVSVETFDLFCRKAIEGREFSKFVFTKSLSTAIEYLKEFGKSYDMDEKKIIHIPLQEFQMLDMGYRSSGDIKGHLSNVLEHYKSQSDITRLIELPSLLISPEDFFGFYQDESRPNFITRNVLSQDLVVIENGYDTNQSLKGKIVMIDSADPGYDWIFGHAIGGLVTKFGGANSHMAIRCAEFGIPAAIGTGDVLYKKLMKAKRIELNCLQKLIRAIS